MKRFIFTFIACILTSMLYCQEVNCYDTISPEIDNGVYAENIDKCSYEGDSSKKVMLIFETNFKNDLVSVAVDGRKKWEKNINTVKTKGVSNEIYEFDYSNTKVIPKITINIARKDCISFYPIRGKRIMYISYIGKGWYIEASNILRSYR